MEQKKYQSGLAVMRAQPPPKVQLPRDKDKEADYS